MKVAVCCSYFADGLAVSLVEKLQPWTPDFHLWALDGITPKLADWTRGSGRLGKFEALNRLLPHAAGADLVLFLDDDVQLPPDFLPQYLAFVNRLGAALAQPALTAGSYHSHPITLERKGCWARLTDFVETGPVVSMTRAFLQLVTPFPESNPMGWGLDFVWAERARQHGWMPAIIDASPVAHVYRSVGERYEKAEAWAIMEQFLEGHGLAWREPHVLREYRRIYTRPKEYLAAYRSSRLEQTPAGGGEDGKLLEAVTGLVRPELAVGLGGCRRDAVHTLAQATNPWGGTVVIADPQCRQEESADEACQFVQMDGEKLYDVWSWPVSLLYFDAERCGAAKVRRWLETWVNAWLADGGVAIFSQLSSDSGSAVRYPYADSWRRTEDDGVDQTVHDWLRQQSRGWYWQDFIDQSGLGLLWRLGSPPAEELAAIQVPGLSSGPINRGASAPRARAAGPPAPPRGVRHACEHRHRLVQ
jgi:hypothetical protein